MTGHIRVILTAFLTFTATWAAPAYGQEASEQTLKVGAILPLSGAESRQGELARRGIELALHDLHSAKLKVILEDNQSQASKAVGAYRKLSNEDKVQAVLALGSPSAMALAPLTNQSRILLFALASTSAYTSPDDYTFRLIGSSAQEAAVLSEVISRKFNKEHTALLFAENDYGQGIRNDFLGRPKTKEALVAEESFAPQSDDVKPQLMKIKARKPGTVVLASWGMDAGNILRQARELRFEGTNFICTQACRNPDLLAAASGAAEGLLIVSASDLVSRELHDSYVIKFHEEPTYAVWRMYDAIGILNKAYEDCHGKLKGSCLFDKISSTRDFPGSAFPMSFDRNGDINENFIVYRVRSGKFELVPEMEFPIPPDS